MREFVTDFVDYPRPADHKGKVCGYTFRGVTCDLKGAHHCKPRADRVVVFFAEQLTFQSGPMALQPFVLEQWQEWQIIRPLFGEVVWTEWGCYGRRYSMADIVMSRKNGKSQLLSGIALYLLIADGEYSAQIYAAAIDTDQAKMVFTPAANMVKVSSELSKYVRHNKQTNTLNFADRASYFKVIPADADGILGANPHGVIVDEILNQPNGNLTNALRTGMGARIQPLMLMATTETDKQVSYGASAIDAAEKVQMDPSRAWHRFAYVRKTPRTREEFDRLVRTFPGHPDLPLETVTVDDEGDEHWSLDIYDERNWRWANPALGTFLKYAAMRQEAQEATESSMAEASFRQFRMNQRQQSATRYIDLAKWDENIGRRGIIRDPAAVRALCAGQTAWAGLDLSSKLDLSAWLLMLPGGEIFTRFWIPEERVITMTEHTGGKFLDWINAGWVTVTEGDTIDYEQVYRDIEADATDFDIQRVVYDRWSGEPVRQRLHNATGVEFVESDTTYTRMTGPMKELTRVLRAGELQHFGNPPLRWMADNLEAKHPTDDPERVRPVKPDRNATGRHIDGMITLLLALDSRLSLEGQYTRSAYEDGDVILVNE